MSRPELPPGLKARVMASRAASPSAPKGAFGRRAMAAAAVGALWLGAALALFGVRGDWGDLPGRYAVGTLAMVGSAAAALAVLGAARGRAMLGPPVAVIIAALAALPLGIAAFLVAVITPGPGSVVVHGVGEMARSSIGCHVLSLLLAVPVLGAMVAVRRGLLVAAPGLLGAALGAAAGAFAHLVVHAHCPVVSDMHVLCGHVLPMLPMMALGALVGRRAFR